MQIFVHSLKNNDFILESKKMELIKKQPDPPNAMWNFIILLKQMNSTINKTFYICSTKSMFLRYKKVSEKAVKFGSFFHSSVHIFLGDDG